MSFSISARPSLLWTVRVISFAALSVCLWLFSRKLTGSIDSVAGCGGAGGCSDVMGGAWSQWFHIPVTVLAAVIYLGVLVLTLPSVQVSLGRTGDQLLAAAGVILAAAAVYFLVILAFVEKQFCPWCLGLHIAGLTVSALILTDAVSKQRSGARGLLEAAMLTGFMAMCVLSAGQIWGPKPDTHLITSGGVTAATPSVPPAPPPPSTGAARTVGFFEGTLNLQFDAAGLPLLGAPNARIILVEFFDYTCSSCRDLSGDLKALKKKWPDVFAVIVLPAPLNRMCNPFLKDQVPNHEGACELAKLSLTLWRAKPAAFPQFHEYLLSLPLPATPEKVEAARSRANQLAGGAAMAEAADDPWINSRLVENISTFQRLTETSIKMPKLLLRADRMFHGTARDANAFIQAVEKEFNLQGQGSSVVSKPQ
ncbi:MAG TPA: vitamin K epoxide reductase family protein [Verrucomicrobiales bacterium]|jgi:uncharacterized membrane protein|nr:vitamin K epoxide reductase family protein [Verrucomicrobiales bacterium]